MAGRRPGTSGTREEILAVARKLFSERGYEGTTIRAIAAGAGVNPALVHHFFGAKEQVFIACVDFPVDPLEVLPEVLAAGPVEEFGQRLATVIVTVWEDEERRAPLLALVRSAMTGAPGNHLLGTMLEKVLMPRLEEAFGTSREQAAAAFAQIAGIMLTRHVIGLEPLASASVADVVAVVAPVIQSTVTPGHSTPGSPGPASGG